MHQVDNPALLAYYLGMTSEQTVLHQLEQNRDRYLSGEELARSLAISRSAIWKAIENLRDEGHVIEGISRRGYRLLTATTQLSKQQLQGLLPSYAVHLFDSLDSTNRYAKVLAGERGDSPSLVIATHQSGGRGRLGRTFFSPKGGLYISVVLPYSFALDAAQLITSAASVATLAAIEMQSGKRCQIKWVNDLYLDGKKVCGILTEGVLGVESGRLTAVVVGIGINLCTPKSAFPEELQGSATSLFDGPSSVPSSFDANLLVASIVLNLQELAAKLPDRSFLSVYRERSLLLGRKVIVHQGKETYCALATGIDDDAHLVVQDEKGCQQVLSSAEVSIRLEV